MHILHAHKLSAGVLWICPFCENSLVNSGPCLGHFTTLVSSRAAQSSLVTYCSVEVWTQRHHWCKLPVWSSHHCRSAKKVHTFSCPFSSQDLVRGYLCCQENWKEQFNFNHLSQEIAVNNRRALVRFWQRIWGFQRANNSNSNSNSILMFVSSSQNTSADIEDTAVSWISSAIDSSLLTLQHCR